MDVLKNTNMMGFLDSLMTFVLAKNDGNQFLRFFTNIFLRELDLKVEYQGNHDSFWDLDIKTEKRESFL